VILFVKVTDIVFESTDIVVVVDAILSSDVIAAQVKRELRDHVRHCLNRRRSILSTDIISLLDSIVIATSLVGPITVDVVVILGIVDLLHEVFVDTILIICVVILDALVTFVVAVLLGLDNIFCKIVVSFDVFIWSFGAIDIVVIFDAIIIFVDFGNVLSSDVVICVFLVVDIVVVVDRKISCHRQSSRTTVWSKTTTARRARIATATAVCLPSQRVLRHLVLDLKITA